MEAVALFSDGEERRLSLSFSGSSVLFSDSTSPPTVVIVPQFDVITRRLSFPGLSSRQIEEILPFQVERLLPSPVADWSYETRIQGTSILIQAIRRETLRAYGKVAVTSEAQALFRYGASYLKLKEPFIVLHRTLHRTTFVESDGQSILRVAICGNQKEEYERVLDGWHPKRRPQVIAVGLLSSDCSDYEKGKEATQALLIGASIDSLSLDPLDFNFLWKKEREKRSLSLFFSSLCFCCLLWIGGEILWSQQLVQLQQKKERLKEERLLWMTPLPLSGNLRSFLALWEDVPLSSIDYYEEGQEQFLILKTKQKQKREWYEDRVNKLAKVVNMDTKGDRTEITFLLRSFSASD